MAALLLGFSVGLLGHEQANGAHARLQGDDVQLVDRLRNLLQLDVIMVLLTGLQAICAGIIGVRQYPDEQISPHSRHTHLLISSVLS